ncbi:MAG: helix-turn-helix domain-containing protein [Bacteroidota bacterium]|jgi:transcriptional regulator with XRE-family HTH domain
MVIETGKKPIEFPNVGRKIRMVRESRQLSQEYVAGRMKISQQAYSRLEHDGENVSLKRLKQLAEALEVPLQSLIGDDDLYIQQNYNQQGGNAGSVLYIQGLADTERLAYENHIADLRRQIKLLESLLAKPAG